MLSLLLYMLFLRYHRLTVMEIGVVTCVPNFLIIFLHVHVHVEQVYILDEIQSREKFVTIILSCETLWHAL